MPDLIAFLICATVVGILVVRLFILQIRINNLHKNLLQAYIDKQIYINELAKEIEKNESSKVENTDGFLNFISQSRDWAYEYIEDAQDKLTKVFKEVDSLDKKTVKKVLEIVDQLRPLLPNGKGK